MKKKTMVTALTLALLLMAGCGGRNEYAIKTAFGAARPEMAAADMVMPQASATMSRQMMAGDAGGRAYENAEIPAMENIDNVERKLVKRADVRIRVDNLAAADASVAALMGKYEAYAASTTIQENAYYYSLRVPATVYDAFLAEMSGMGRLLRRSENTEDVTLRYYDLEGRLETKKELLKTFQAYLKTAKTIEEILAVEARISELQYDIEGTGMQLRHLANQVDYATIDLNLMGPVAAAPGRNVTFGERLKQVFGSFSGFLAVVAVGIVGFVIYGIPVLLLAVFFFWLLFGKVGLLKKLWCLVMGKRQHAVDS